MTGPDRLGRNAGSKGSTGWTRRDIAAKLGRPVGTIRNWGLLPHFPTPIGRVGLENVYDPAHIRRWAEQHDLEVSSTRWSMQRAAAELDISFNRIRNARQRGRLPTPDGFVGNRPWWAPAAWRAWHDQTTQPDGTWDRHQVAAFLGRTTPPPLRDLPAPDGHSTRRPWWRPDTIRSWHQARLEQQATAAERAGRVRFERLPEQLYGKDVAAAMGLSWDTIRTYRRRGVLPEPDGSHGHRPWWSTSTIERWNRSRRHHRSA